MIKNLQRAKIYPRINNVLYLGHRQRNQQLQQNERRLKQTQQTTTKKI